MIKIHNKKILKVLTTLSLYLKEYSASTEDFYKGVAFGLNLARKVIEKEFNEKEWTKWQMIKFFII